MITYVGLDSCHAAVSTMLNETQSCAKRPNAEKTSEIAVPFFANSVLDQVSTRTLVLDQVSTRTLVLDQVST